MLPHDDAGPGVLAENLRGAIGRSVVHYDDFFRASLREGRLANAFQHLIEGAEFVVDGNDYGNQHGVSSTANSDYPKGGRAISSSLESAGTSLSNAEICFSDCVSRFRMREFSHQPKKPAQFM